MKSRKWWYWFGAIVLAVTAVAGVCLGTNWDTQDEEKYPDRGVPILALELNGASLEEFKTGVKNAKYSGNTLELYDGGVSNFYEGVELKGRGNTTWGQPKKPFQIKFDSAGEFLGMNGGKKWAILANYLDASYLRNDISLKVAEMLGTKYAERGKYVEVYFDGEYEGLYYAVRRIEIGKNGVDLRQQDGLLVELDNVHRDPDDACYRTYSGSCLVVKDSVVDDVTQIDLAMADFLTDFNQLELAAEQKDFARVAELADVDDLVKYFLVNEVVVNPDAYSTSFYWHRDGMNDKLHAGPVWDFDLALANPEWIWSVDGAVFSPTRLMARRAEVFGQNGGSKDEGTERLMYWLMEMPEFQAEVRRVFTERLMGRSQELMTTARQTEELIEAAAHADAEKWGKEEFEINVDKVLNWLQVRYEFMEENFGDEGMRVWGVV